MISFRSGVLAAAFAIFCVVSSLPDARPAAAQAWAPVDSATFEIYQDDRLLGVEHYRSFRTNDTLIVASALELPGASPNSTLPRYKDTMFFLRSLDSYPLVFHVSETGRDSTESRSLRVSFNDTTAVIYRESWRGGVGDAVAIPPGRLYLLEPGIYGQIQKLLGDFVQSKQHKRKQAVLIPAIAQIVDITLARGPQENLGQGRFMVKTTRVDMTDKMTSLSAWLDSGGRMWKLEAPAQGLRVERLLPEALLAEPAAETPTATKKGAAKR